MSGERPEDFDFEAALEELEEIVGRLDREGVALDEAIDLFERGVRRLRQAHRWLDEASGRVEELIAETTGALRARPLDPEGPGAASEAGEDGG